MGNHAVICVGDVLQFNPVVRYDLTKRRTMYVLITKIWSDDRWSDDQRCCDCVMLYDSHSNTDYGWEAGSVVPWPYAYISDSKTWQKIL